MNEKTYVIYVHINKINLKVYVGQTCQDVNRRWRNGKSYTTDTNTHFASAIKKYGWDNFEHIILESGLTKNQANFYEKMYIKTYNSTNREYGYNRTYGGEGMLATDEVCKKMREHHANFKGENSPRYGISLKDIMSIDDYNSYLERCRISAKKRVGSNSSNHVEVYCYELDRTFNTVTEAFKETGVSIGAISSCINGRTEFAGYSAELNLRLHWCKLRDKDNFKPKLLPNKRNIGEQHQHALKIYCFELDEVFYGVNEVERKYGIYTGHILDCARGKRNSCGKHPETNAPLHWCFYDEKDTYEIPDINKTYNLGKLHPQAHAIYCIELNEIFDTAVNAKSKYGFDACHIREVCKHQRKTCGKHPITNEKLHWLYIEDAISLNYVSNSSI